MKNSLTPKEEKLMLEVRDEWIDRFNSLPRINKEKLERGVVWLYKLCGFKTPTIYIVSEPLSAQCLKEILKENTVGETVRNTVGETVWETVENTVWETVGNTVWKTVWETVENTVWETVGNTVWKTVWETVRNTVRKTVGETVGETVWKTVGETVRNTVWETVGNTVWETVGETVGDTVGDTVGETVRNTVWETVFEPFSYYGGLWSFAWVSFYDFFSRIGIVSNKDFDSFKDFLQSNVFMCLYYENAVIVVENPIAIYRDSNQNLHRIDGCAIEFSNGLGIHYIHGREVPAKYFGQLTKEDFINETNEDYRAAMFEILGEQGVLDLLGAEIVDQQEVIHNVEYKEQIVEEKEVLTLFKTTETFSELDNQPLAWVKYICPSTGSNYLISCEPHHTSAVEAAKSLTDFDWEENESYHWNARS